MAGGPPTHRQRQRVPSTAEQHVAHIVGAGVGDYHLSGNEKLPRAVDHELRCSGASPAISASRCVRTTLFNIKSVEGTEGRQQYLVFSELCNECGNCMTFCPEDGDPAKVKPRLYTDPDLFARREGQDSSSSTA
ncbi:MAG: hypothetical protein R2710_08015 [Acidimicrobiales bacterium]